MKSEDPYLIELTDYNLLERMSKADEGVAREAWGRLYHRHWRYLVFVCIRACKRRGRIHDAEKHAEDVASETFRRAYMAASGFKAGQHTEKDAIRWHVRAWLGKIAVNYLNELERKNAKQPPVIDFVHLHNVALGKRCTAKASQDDVQKVLRSLIDSDFLNDRERDVLYAKMEVYDPESREARLDEATIRHLMAKHSLSTSGRIRAVYSRTQKKLGDKLLSLGLSLK